mmetsp:Transcript_2544/g.6444  ORF Transcript_2544/g.6444 Transcript_2544/m.6444 type:complete len:284 (+) Transcript_2544:1711-2562(+)
MLTFPVVLKKSTVTANQTASEAPFAQAPAAPPALQPGPAKAKSATLSCFLLPKLTVMCTSTDASLRCLRSRSCQSPLLKSTPQCPSLRGCHKTFTYVMCSGGNSTNENAVSSLPGGFSVKSGKLTTAQHFSANKSMPKPPLPTSTWWKYPLRSTLYSGMLTFSVHPALPVVLLFSAPPVRASGKLTMRNLTREDLSPEAELDDACEAMMKAVTCQSCSLLLGGEVCTAMTSGVMAALLDEEVEPLPLACGDLLLDCRICFGTAMSAQTGIVLMAVTHSITQPM